MKFYVETLLKMVSRTASAIGLVLAGSFLAAQAANVELTAQGDADKDIRVGVFINVQPNCSSGPLPNIRLVTSPAHGRVIVKKANFNATNYKQCLAITGPAFIALYHSDKDFSGTDSLVLEVHYQGGRDETQHIVVTVHAPGPGQTI